MRARLVIGLVLLVSGCPQPVVEAVPDATTDAARVPEAGFDVASTDVRPDTPGSTDADSDSGVDDASIDDAPAQDTATSDAADAADEADAALPASGTIFSQVSRADDAVASYLLDAAQGAWNLLGGATVPVGRHFDVDHVSYHTALRFVDVRVPQSAVIDSARLSFYPHNEVDSSRNLWLDIYAERSADSAPFDLQEYAHERPDQRLRTSAHIDHWLVRCNADCTELSEYDCPQRQLDCWNRDATSTCPKDLAALVQEVVDLPGWSPGNALTLLLINAATDEDGAAYQGSRTVTGYDPQRGLEYAPELEVSYHTP